MLSTQSLITLGLLADSISGVETLVSPKPPFQSTGNSFVDNRNENLVDSGQIEYRRSITSEDYPIESPALDTPIFQDSRLPSNQERLYSTEVVDKPESLLSNRLLSELADTPEPLQDTESDGLNPDSYPLARFSPDELTQRISALAGTITPHLHLDSINLDFDALQSEPLMQKLLEITHCESRQDTPSPALALWTLNDPESAEKVIKWSNKHDTHVTLISDFPQRIREKISNREYNYRVIGHRGDLEQSIENTLPAFEHSLAKGFGFEFDLLPTGDQQFVIGHEDNLSLDEPCRTPSSNHSPFNNEKLPKYFCDGHPVDPSSEAFVHEHSPMWLRQHIRYACTPIANEHRGLYPVVTENFGDPEHWQGVLPQLRELLELTATASEYYHLPDDTSAPPLYLELKVDDSVPFNETEIATNLLNHLSELEQSGLSTKAIHISTAHLSLLSILAELQCPYPLQWIFSTDTLKKIDF